MAPEAQKDISEKRSDRRASDFAEMRGRMTSASSIEERGG